MQKQEKVRIIEGVVVYARGNAYNCLNCVGPGGWNYAAGGLNCRGGNSSDVQRINAALTEIGLTAEEVDSATEIAGIVEGGGPLGLSSDRINGCCNVDSFLKVVKNLL